MIAINLKNITMSIKPVLLLLVATLISGCIIVPPPPNRSVVNPADTSAPEAATSRYKPNLVAGTRVYLDPAVGAGAQKMDMKGMEGMDHSKMKGMEGMEGMDHSKMPGMEGMDHSKMPGMNMDKQPPGAPAQQPGGMEGMDHSKMKGMEGMEGMKQPKAAQSADKEAVAEEMKKTSDEMKKLSDEMKAKSDATKASDTKGKKDAAAAPSPSPSAAYYTCVMHPQVKQSNPGKCPICGMTLVKKDASKKEDE